MKIIDPHIHLFDLKLGEYTWLNSNNAPNWPDKTLINKSFSVNHLTLDAPLNLAGFVHIEAGFDNLKPWREIEWLEQSVNLPFKSIASADITSTPEYFVSAIAMLTKYTSVVGVRHMFDQDALAILTAQHANTNLAHLAALGLIFETQISGDDVHAITAFQQMAMRHPALRLILSHGCFAPLDSKLRTPWAINMQSLARCPNIVIKASGWEMVSRRYNMSDISRVVEDLLCYFGQDRVMLASNFPLTLFSTSYHELWSAYCDLALPKTVLNKLLIDNAARIYQLSEHCASDAI